MLYALAFSLCILTNLEITMVMACRQKSILSRQWAIHIKQCIYKIKKTP